MKILYRFLFTLMFHILSTRVIIPIMIKSIYQFSVNRIHVGQAARRLNVNFNWIYHTSEIVQLLSHQIEVMTTLFECVSTKAHTHTQFIICHFRDVHINKWHPRPHQPFYKPLNYFMLNVLMSSIVR